MAATSASTPNLGHSSISVHSITHSPPIKGLKKVFQGRRRSSDVQHEDVNASRQSVDSLALDRSPTLPSIDSNSGARQDENNRSGTHSINKYMPGHDKRERARVHEAELEILDQEPLHRGRIPEPSPRAPPGALDKNRSVSSLLTDGSDYDSPPPMVSRKSHMGYLTTSSPLMTTKSANDGQARPASTASTASLPTSTLTESFPVILEPEPDLERTVSTRSQTLDLRSTPVLPSPTLVDRADTLQVGQPVGRRGSISKLRSISPARKIRDVFSRSTKSPRSSPERESSSKSASNRSLPDQLNLAERRLADKSNKLSPASLQTTDSVSNSPSASPRQPPVPETKIPVPQTPPSTQLSTPLTTVTPPTPTDIFRGNITASPKVVDEFDQHEENKSEKTISAPGNNVTHRRTRSGSANTHQKSKLSTSTMPPLTPTIEEGSKTPSEKSPGGRNFTAGSGFFSSWVSAAQTAATSITNLTGQNRSRAGTSSSEPTRAKSIEEEDIVDSDTADGETARKKLAVETLGSGDLDFSQLGLDSSSEDKKMLASRPDLSSLRKKSDLQRHEAQAKVDDALAKRAVSAAYEEVGEGTPVAEISDPVAQLKLVPSLDNPTLGTRTPPNGSVYEENAAVKRSNSVRSKLGKRRSRGSSIATGQSTVGTTFVSNNTSQATLAPGPRVTGFTPAPKQRNRAYHQQFRSVPEDDNLIEDYSCALQKEILLAGRIYISEGHICFSSNILGWVTTLIISFEEIVSIEREYTAMIIPNAIAIQTLHARHTFRSLLSREATFDLMIGIWKVNHPASFSKSVNGKQFIAEQARHHAEKALGTPAAEEEASEASSDEESGSGSDDDDHDEDSAHSVTGSNASIAGSEFLEAKSVTRKPSGTNATLPVNSAASVAPAGDVAAAASVAATTASSTVDFPGPVAHGPTDCTDAGTHYDKVVKDEIISAPLGKIYSLLYGPQSGAFLRKYLVDECKCLDLVLEDDKKGLGSDAKSRQYSYIKPLGGSIGPKQTKCITTENLDFFDLDKSISVTCTTQTPDVPSGSSFSTKTRYCLSWAPGNATRLQMNCTIEWTAKSWLKGPIEKGANDGQQQYGDGLVKVLKAALGRSRGATVSSKGAKGKKKRKGERKTKSEQTGQATHQNTNWGLFEPLRTTLEPVVDTLKPVIRVEVVLAILSIMVIILWFGRGSRQGGHLTRAGTRPGEAERLVAYEQLWQREESELWDWLEERAGVNRALLDDPVAPGGKADASNSRRNLLKDKSMAAKLQAEKWSHKEMQEAVRVTRQRLDEMQRLLDEKAL